MASLPLPLPLSSSSHAPLPSRRFRLGLSVVCSASAGAGARTVEERNREAVLRSDVDLANAKPRPPRRGKRGAREEMKGKKAGQMVEKPEEPQPPPRETHRLLKVLAGTANRKKLLSPKGMDVRPMMEVVKGSVFSIIQACSGSPVSLRPGRWLDLYSGTGSVGIEALSRGCTEAHFVEMDPWVVSDVLKPNLKCTGFLDASVIHTTRVENFLEQTDKLQGAMGSSFEYVSVTPPYTAVDYNILMGLLEKSPLVGKDTFLIVEYPLQTKLSDFCGDLVKIADRRFGRTQFVIYGPTWSQKRRRSDISSTNV